MLAGHNDTSVFSTTWVVDAGRLHGHMKPYLGIQNNERNKAIKYIINQQPAANDK